MQALAALLLISAAGCGWFSQDSDQSDSGAANGEFVVTKVVDGDTMDVTSAGTTLRIRMIGFNTPESVDPRKPVECFGKEASNHLAELAPEGTPVRLERDVEQEDRYGRTLAYVYRTSDDLFLNLQMVADGYAHALSIPPNITFADRFRDAERSARTADIGLWTACPDS